ncbi:FMRFamide receptor [Caerostris extrusa]|uniref:FMRFamide receptor n=1 Tax=Caerostris extrusa TaxID=172846 RepID=A0AAV4WBI8_CAEEX|nr:FMRFamide receptor [Caerostris extrusa]
MKGKVFCTESRAKKAIVAVFLFCFAFTIPTPFEWKFLDSFGAFVQSPEGFYDQRRDQRQQPGEQNHHHADRCSHLVLCVPTPDGLSLIVQHPPREFRRQAVVSPDRLGQHLQLPDVSECRWQLRSLLPPEPEIQKDFHPDLLPLSSRKERKHEFNVLPEHHSRRDSPAGSSRTVFLQVPRCSASKVVYDDADEDSFTEDSSQGQATCAGRCRKMIRGPWKHIKFSMGIHEKKTREQIIPLKGVVTSASLLQHRKECQIRLRIGHQILQSSQSALLNIKYSKNHIGALFSVTP